MKRELGTARCGPACCLCSENVTCKGCKRDGFMESARCFVCISGSHEKKLNLMKKQFVIAVLLMLVFAVSVSTVQAETTISQPFDTIGSIVAFGRYEQDGNEENGPEEIEWIVLDVKDRRSLLISRYALDTVPYHTEDINITWEKCILRSWLNSDFLQTAFSDAEQRLILEAEVDNSQKQGLKRWNNWKKTKGGKDTKDRIFLLSYREANQYLGVTWDGEENPSGRAEMTEFLRQKTADNPYYRDVSEDHPRYGFCYWWLRSPGYLQNLVAQVAESGVLIAGHSTSGEVAIRPALWLNLNAAVEKDGDTTVKIDGVVYYNTKKVIPVEPDESVIVNKELPIDGSMTDEKITAYAFINEGQSGDILVCLIDGEWYQFIATERAGQP